MNHVAVDLGSRKSQFCIRSPDGKIIDEGKIETKALGTFFRKVEKSRVVLETCSEAFAIADLATSAGHEVCVVPAMLAPTLGVGQRGVKTDRKDAQNLSMSSCRMERLPNVHVPPKVIREQRAALTHRGTLVAARTMLVNSVKGWMRRQLLTPLKGTTSTLPQRVRDAALAEPDGLPSYIERTLKVLEELNKTIVEANQELEESAEKDEICRRLMTMPGVGPVTSMSYRAAIDDVKRFKTPHGAESFLGLTPGENSTGTTRQNNRLGITRAGPVKVRTALVQAAWCAYRTKPGDPMVQWARKLAEKKKVHVAIVALARKMAGILFAMWRDEANYSPAHQRAKPVEAAPPPMQLAPAQADEVQQLAH